MEVEAPRSHRAGESPSENSKLATRFRHDPYRPTVMTPIFTSPDVARTAKLCGSAADSNAESHAPSRSSTASLENSSESLLDVPRVAPEKISAVSVEEQFQSCIGNIPAAARSLSGRLTIVTSLYHRPECLDTVLYEVLPQLEHLATDTHASGVIEALISLVNTQGAELIIGALSDAGIVEIATTTKHSRGVLLALFECIPSFLLERVVNVVAREVEMLSRSQQGCISLMRVLERADPMHQSHIVNSFLQHFWHLSFDPFGNYVAQTVLSMLDAPAIKVLVETYDGSWLALCTNKFSSNVMERILRCVDDSSRDVILSELCYGTEDTVCTLINDAYGNFVFQAAIQSTRSMPELLNLAAVVRPLLATCPFARRVETRLQGTFAKFNQTRGGPAPSRRVWGAQPSTPKFGQSAGAATAAPNGFRRACPPYKHQNAARLPRKFAGINCVESGQE